MPLSFFTDSVTRLRPVYRDVRGSRVPDWSNPDRLTISGCSVQQSGTNLDQQGRFAVMDGLTLYAPAGADILAGDRIGYQGDVFTIDGDPREWKSPTGRVSTVQCPLKRWEG